MKSLIKFLTIAALLCPLASGQISTMEQIPTWRQADGFNSSASHAYPQNIVSGNVLMVTWHSRDQLTAPTIADTMGNTWTLRISADSTIDNRANLYVWTATANSSGADTVTITAAGTSIDGLGLFEIANVIETLDGTAATDGSKTLNTSTPTSFPSITTTSYRSLVINIAQTVGGDNIAPAPGTPTSFPILAENTDQTYVLYNIPTSNPGSISGSQIIDDNSRNVALATFALKSASSLTVTNGSLPTALVSTSYSYQMGAKGGTGSNVWSISSGSLPPGLSLSSGGLISGTPTGSAAGSTTFLVTDGASHTASATFTLVVGTSVNTIAPVQQTSNGFNGCATTMGSSVTSGNMLVVTAANNASSPQFTDTRGTIFWPLPLLSGQIANSSGLGFTQVWVGFLTSSGSDTINCDGLRGGPINVTEWSNVQQVFDTTISSVNSSTSGGSTITSNSITLPVNELFLASGYIGTSSGSGSTITANSPLSSDFQNGAGGGNIRGGYNTGASAGSTSAGFAVAGNATNSWVITVYGLRPTTTGLAPTGSIRHRVTN